MKLFKEFKEFAVKGNMIEIAIGVIIGAAFNKVIDVMVKEVFMPPLTLITNGLSWDHKKIVLREAVVTNETVILDEVAIAYGKLVEAGIDFIIIGFTVFLVIKALHRIKNKADDPKDVTIKTPKDIELLYKLTELIEQQNNLLQGKITTNNRVSKGLE